MSPSGIRQRERVVDLDPGISDRAIDPGERSFQARRGGSRILRNIEGNLAREAFSVPLEMHFALVLVRNHPFHHSRAEPLTGRCLDWRPAQLGPAQDEPSIYRPRPLDLNMSFGYRQSSVLGCIGG